MAYGYSIPDNVVQIWEKQILKTQDVLKDAVIARNVQFIRTLPETVDIDTVQFVAGSGDDDIPAKVVAKGAPPDVTDVRIAETDFRQYQISVGFYMNERELKQDPMLKNRKIDWAVRQIHRREDYMFFNGDSAIGLRGLQTAARSNPNGKIVKSGASGPDVNNKGAWDGSTKDIYADVLEAVNRLGAGYDPTYLIGRRSDLGNIYQMDSMRNSFAEKIGQLFGTNDPTQFIRYSAYCPEGYVYVVAKDPMASEFVLSQDVRIVDEMIREKGGNYWVEINEWVNPFQCYDEKAFVEIEIT